MDNQETSIGNHRQRLFLKYFFEDARQRYGRNEMLPRRIVICIGESCKYYLYVPMRAQPRT